jgi:hypothetical protein
MTSFQTMDLPTDASYGHHGVHADTPQRQNDSIILRELEKEREARREERERDRDIRASERTRADALHKDLELLRHSYKQSQFDLETAHERIGWLEAQLDRERQKAVSQGTDAAVMNTISSLQVRHILPLINRRYHDTVLRECCVLQRCHKSSRLGSLHFPRTPCCSRTNRKRIAMI